MVQTQEFKFNHIAIHSKNEFIYSLVGVLFLLKNLNLDDYQKNRYQSETPFLNDQGR